ncbi:MAG: hypothetical protein K2I66_05365 [Bacteroidales bacterium]|nr:hypothetical protein [Bacteroidales bacterium]
MTAEELDKIWEELMTKEEEDRAAWDALSEEEKKAIHDEFDEGFRERMTDNPLGNDD